MFYTQSNLDRSDHIRKDSEALDTLWHNSNARIVPVWKDQSILISHSDRAAPEAMFLKNSDPIPTGQSIFLGMEGEIPFFAVDISSANDEQAQHLASLARNCQGSEQTCHFVDLRVAGPSLAALDGSLLAYARGLTIWNTNTQFCTRCGNAMRSSNGGHVRTCSNEQCAYMAFPRTDPAVIMLVTYQPTSSDEPLCLLGRSPQWPEGVFSTLAGFVEPGESLESAVQREVFEEVSVRTEDVQYVASQPWPFPRSIMLGFEAKATTKHIQCDPDEIADASWFNRHELKEFGNWGDDAPGNKLPRPDSIARFLIDRWIRKADANANS